MKLLRLGFMVVVAATWVAATTPARQVFAHAGYERSNPAPDSVIRATPATVDIWFTQDLFRRAGANTITVTGPGGESVAAGDAVIDPADRKHLSVTLPAGLPAGEYRVAWTSLSATDGDPADGAFSFKVDPAAPESTPVQTPAAQAGIAQPTPPPPQEQSRDGQGVSSTNGSSFPMWALLGAGGILLSGAVGAWALLATGRNQEG